MAASLHPHLMHSNPFALRFHQIASECLSATPELLLVCIKVPMVSLRAPIGCFRAAVGCFRAPISDFRAAMSKYCFYAFAITYITCKPASVGQ